jgi:hypothetical protein
MAKSSTNQMAMVARWLFVIGVIIAVVLGLIGSYIGVTLANPWVVIILVVIGLVVGFLNVTEKESSAFLLAAIGLVIINNMSSSSLGAIPPLQEVVKGISILAVPAAIVVALKTIFTIAKD